MNLSAALFAPFKTIGFPKMSNDAINATGSDVSPTSVTSGNLHDQYNDAKTVNEIAARVARIESRLVQLMLHVGANPYEKTYERDQQAPRKRVPDRR